MNRYILIFLVYISLQCIAQAQNLLQNGTFQAYSCNWSATQGVDNFQQGCFGSQWKSVTVNQDPSGQPTTVTSGGASAGLESGNYYAKLYTTNPGTQGVNYTYQGIYYEGLTLYQSIQYTLTCKVRKGVSNQFNIRLFNSLPASVGTSFLVASGNTSNDNNWETLSFTFKPNNTYTQLYLYNIATYNTLEIDDIEITYALVGDPACCTPNITYANTSTLPTFTRRSVYINTQSNSPVTVTTAQNVAFQAGEYIELNPGFQANLNSNFLAYISYCPTSAPATPNAGPDIINTCLSSSSSCRSIGSAPLPNVSYSWGASPANRINNLSSVSISNPNVCGPMASGTVTYTLYATNSCGTSSDNMTLVVSLCRVGIISDQEELALNSDVSEQNNILCCNPNPSSGHIFVSLPTSLSEAKITVKDMNGKNVIEQNIKSGETRLDLTNVPKGIYFVLIESELDNISKKIIIQ